MTKLFILERERWLGSKKGGVSLQFKNFKSVRIAWWGHASFCYPLRKFNSTGREVLMQDVKGVMYFRFVRITLQRDNQVLIFEMWPNSNGSNGSDKIVSSK